MGTLKLAQDYGLQGHEDSHSPRVTITTTMQPEQALPGQMLRLCPGSEDVLNLP